MHKILDPSAHRAWKLPWAASVTGMGHQLTLVVKQREQSSLLIEVQISG